MEDECLRGRIYSLFFLAASIGNPKTRKNGYIINSKKIDDIVIKSHQYSMYRGFHEKGTLSYPALEIDR